MQERNDDIPVEQLENSEETELQVSIPPTHIRNVIKHIKTAERNEDITRQDVKALYAQLGLTRSFFNPRKVDEKKKKHKAKLAKAARRKNRK